MTKVKTVTVTLPNEEEFSKFTEEEMAEHYEALENVSSFEELIELLKDMGIELIEDNTDGPGPNDTIH